MNGYEGHGEFSYGGDVAGDAYQNLDMDTAAEMATALDILKSFEFVQ